MPGAPGSPSDATPGPDSLADAGLSDLRDRLGELQHRVELLGSQGVWPETGSPAGHSPGPPPHAPQVDYGSYGGYEPAPGGFGQLPAVGGNPPPPQGPARGPRPEPGGYPPQQAPPPQAPQAPPLPPAHQAPGYGYQPAGEQFAPPEPAPQAYGYDPQGTPYESGPPVPEVAAAPPVATNGHSEDPAEVSARSTSVALVDAGPFDDLIQLRHFEDELASLTAVRDVRVRRFGHGRASIEVGLTGPYALSRELYRLGRQMSVSDGAAGDLIVDLAPTIADDAEIEARAGDHLVEEETA